MIIENIADIRTLDIACAFVHKDANILQAPVQRRW